MKDFDFDSKPSRLSIRGEYTKTRTDRTIFLTDEIANQLKSWMDYKYRTRGVCTKIDEMEKQYRNIELLLKIILIKYSPFIRI